MSSDTGSPLGLKSHALPLVFTTRVYPASFLWIDLISPSIGKSVPAVSGVMPAGESSLPSSLARYADKLFRVTISSVFTSLKIVIPLE